MEWKEIIGKYLPKVAGVALNPVTGGIDLVGSVLGDIFGFDFANTSPDDAEKIISQDPAMKLKLRLAEMDFTLRQREQDLSELKAYIADIQSARSRQVETEKATGRKDYNLYILAWVIMGGFIGLIGGMIILESYFKVTLSNNPLLSLLVGSLATDAGMVVGYFFGSSKSSSEKNEMFHQALIKK